MFTLVTWYTPLVLRRDRDFSHSQSLKSNCRSNYLVYESKREALYSSPSEVVSTHFFTHFSPRSSLGVMFPLSWAAVSLSELCWHHFFNVSKKFARCNIKYCFLPQIWTENDGSYHMHETQFYLHRAGREQLLNSICAWLWSAMSSGITCKCIWKIHLTKCVLRKKKKTLNYFPFFYVGSFRTQRTWNLDSYGICRKAQFYLLFTQNCAWQFKIMLRRLQTHFPISLCTWCWKITIKTVRQPVLKYCWILDPNFPGKAALENCTQNYTHIPVRFQPLNFFLNKQFWEKLCFVHLIVH